MAEMVLGVKVTLDDALKRPTAEYRPQWRT